MADLPWYKYFPTLFDADTSLLSNRAVGGWQRLLNYMNPKKIETIEGDYGYFSRILRCQTPETKLIIDELSEQDICDIIINANFVTLTSRKIKRENTTRENNKIRQQRKRGHAVVTPLVPTSVTHDVTPNVTGEMLDVRSKRLEDKNKKNKADAFILPEYINTELWDEFLAHRKTRKAPNTPRALEAVIKNINALSNDNGYTPDDLMEIILERGWLTIKKEWLSNYSNNKKQSAPDDKNRITMEELEAIVKPKYDPE